jgi:hypothetical protein
VSDSHFAALVNIRLLTAAVLGELIHILRKRLVKP